MKIAILGGGGCFGLAFARHLAKLGVDCFGIGRSDPKPKAFWLAPPKYRYWALDLISLLEAAAGVIDKERPDYVVNFAAQGEGAASFGSHAPDFFRTNSWGMARLALEIRRREYVKRFIHVGTSEVYGSVNRPALETEDHKGTSPYCLSKQAFDDYLLVLSRIHGFPMNIVRPSNCMVEGQQLHRIVPKAAICALSGKKLPLHGGGRARKSYLHADDLSKAIMSVIEKGKPGEVYNVGPSAPISIRALVEHTLEVCGASWEEVVEETEDRTGQDGCYWLDSTKIAADCGWTQTIGLTKGIERVVRWIGQYPELLSLDMEYRHRA